MRYDGLLPWIREWLRGDGILWIVQVMGGWGVWRRGDGGSRSPTSVPQVLPEQVPQLPANWHCQMISSLAVRWLFVSLFVCLLVCLFVCWFVCLNQKFS